MHKALRPSDDIERLYVSRKERETRLTSTQRQEGNIKKNKEILRLFVLQ